MLNLLICYLLNLLTSHSLMILSHDTDAISLLSGLKATALSNFSRPSKVCMHFLLSISHSLMVLSCDPDASSLPSWLKATE